jgi:hypothetical protein
LAITGYIDLVAVLAEKLLQQVEYFDIIVDNQQMAHTGAPRTEGVKANARQLRPRGPLRGPNDSR